MTIAIPLNSDRREEQLTEASKLIGIIHTLYRIGLMDGNFVTSEATLIDSELRIYFYE